MIGLPNPWVILAVGAAWLASLVGVGWWQRSDGATAERVKWEQRENVALRDANRELDAAHRRIREQERAAAERLAQVSANFQKELAHARQATRDRVAAAHAGTLRLRDPAAAHHACPDRTGEAAPAAGRRDDPAPGEFSGTATAFLLELTGEADDVARQLAACQAVIHADRAGPGLKPAGGLGLRPPS